MPRTGSRRRSHRHRKGYTNHGVVEGPVIVRGEQQHVRVQRPTLRIDREEGTHLRLRRGEGGTDRLIVQTEGARPRPEPERRNYFNIAELERDMAERIADVHRRFPFDMATLPEVKRTGRFFGEEGLLTELRNWRKAISRKEWIGWHPVKLIERAFSRKYGRGAYRRDLRARARAVPFRQRFRGPAEQLVAQYHAEMAHALQQLQAAAESGRINWENRNLELNKYKKKLGQIEKRFLNQRTLMMETYMKQKKAARAA
jgi:hypothetical protein